MNNFNSDINPKNYYGVVFELSTSDERFENFQKQRLERGFDDTEIWSLDYSIILFALPRIKRLLEIERNIHRDNLEENSNYFKDLEQIISDLEEYDSNKTDLTLFFKYFKQLWY